MSGIITLLTDFGVADGYVGAMKGAILSISPSAVLVDISQEVTAQDVRSGAFTLMTSTDTFPEGTVHLAVVDPGVGGHRRAVAVSAGGSYFVGPDNGLLSWAVASRSGVPMDGDTLTVGPAVMAVVLDEASYWRATVSSTFHGRDIFGPVAAYLSRGEPLEHLGSPVESILSLPFPNPVRMGNSLIGEVLVVDHFGNCITNVHGDELGTRDQFEIAGQTIDGLSPNYESEARFVALIGSSGFLEIATPGGNAAEQLNVGVGATVLSQTST